MKKKTCGNAKRLAAGSVAVVLGLLAQPVSADDTYVLATSKTHKLSVIAEGGAAWCGPNLRLRMVLDADSPDSRNAAGQIDIMNRLKTPITNDCKTANAVDLAVFEQGKQAGAFRATADGGWVFAAVATPTPPPAVKAQIEPSPAAPATAAGSTQPPAPAAPSAAPIPITPAPQTAASAPAPAAPPAPPASASTPAIPKDLDYAAAVLRVIRDNPALGQDEGMIRWWAFYRFNREYQQVANQEFKLQPVLEKAKADLAETLGRTDTDHVAVAITTEFGSYDFNARRFPITVKLDTLLLNRPCCVVLPPTVPGALAIKVPDLDSITGLPMDNDAAQAFVQKRTQWGYVNRGLHILAIIKLDPTGFQKDQWGNLTASGSLDGAAIFADPQGTQVLSWLSPGDIETMRTARAAEKAAAAKAEAERQAEIRRQRMAAQRDQDIRSLANAPLSVKLANFVSDGQVNYFIRLSSLRSARGEALVGGRPVDVAMLIQADGSGRNKVDSKWPGKLQVTVAEGQPDLTSSGWYLVRGPLTVPEGDALPPAQLTAQTVYACTQPKCAEAADATAIVDHKLAAMGVVQ